MQEDKFEFKKADNYDIKKDKNVRLTRYKNGDYKITDIKKETAGFNKCLRRSKTKYIDTETGEEKEYNINEYKTEQGLSNSLKRSKRTYNK